MAPPTVFRDAAGVPGNLEQFRGKVVVIAFWGTTCVPCKKELPEFVPLAKKFQEEGLAVLPICLDEPDAATASASAAAVAPGLPIYVAADESVRKGYHIIQMPQAAIIDREGRIVARFGGADWAAKPMEELLRSLLADR